jgi:hypothetical protein
MLRINSSCDARVKKPGTVAAYYVTHVFLDGISGESSLTIPALQCAHWPTCVHLCLTSLANSGTTRGVPISVLEQDGLGITSHSNLL